MADDPKQHNRALGEALTGARITKGESNPLVFRILEVLTGIPLDPDFYRFGSRQDIFMNTVPQIAAGIGGGVAAALGKPKVNPPRPQPEPSLEPPRIKQFPWDPEPTHEVDLQRAVGDLEGGMAWTRGEPGNPTGTIDTPEYLPEWLLQRIMKGGRPVHPGEDYPYQYNLQDNRALAHIASNKPLTRREFFRRAGETHRSWLRDRAHRVQDEAIEVERQLMDEGVDTMTTLPEDFPVEFAAEARLLQNLSQEADDLYRRAYQPPLLDRMRAAVKTADTPTQTIKREALRAVDPSGQRRLFFEAMWKALQPKK